MTLNKSESLPIDIGSNLFQNIPATLFCIFGTVTNLINIIVFLNPKLKNFQFKYLLSSSVCDIFYLGLLSFQLVVMCNECEISKTYLTQLYAIIVDFYLTSGLALAFILIEIWISLQRYLMLKNKVCFLNRIAWPWIVTILALVSFLLYLPILFRYSIIEQENFNNQTHQYKTTYSLKPTNFAESFGKKIFVGLGLLRILLNTFVLSAVNLLVLNEFKKNFNKKIRLKSMEMSKYLKIKPNKFCLFHKVSKF